MEFKNVTDIQAHFGEVIKIQETSTGKILWEKVVVEAGYPKMIIAQKRTEGTIYYSNSAPSSLLRNLQWSVNDLALSTGGIGPKSAVGDVLTAYYVNNSSELASFPSSGHLITDAVWSFNNGLGNPNISLAGQGYSFTFGNPYDGILPNFIGLSSQSGSSVSISYIASDFSSYVSAFETALAKKATPNKTTYPTITGSIGLLVSSASLGITLDYPIVYVFKAQR